MQTQTERITQTQTQTADKLQKTRMRHKDSRRVTEDVDGADEADANADIDRADDASTGTVDTNKAVDNLAQA